ncbi:MAG TPA: SpoIIE family protein phosphatase [Bacteroidia bacterium]|nr:SpoIIE family protein phosphatase [Bacteroidia bacterium]
MYFGNTSGILKYDGKKWTIIERTTVISMSFDASSKMVFIGGIDNFGYITINNEGVSKYVKLSDKLSNREKIGYVWDCFSTKDGVFFLTPKKLYRYKNGNLKIWDTKSEFHAAYEIDNKVIVREIGTGLLCIEGDLISFVNGSERFGNSRVEFIGKDIENPNQYSLYSREEGLCRFTLSKEGTNYTIYLTSINNTVSKLLQENEVYRGIVLKNNQIAFSTIVGGLIIVDKNGRVVLQLNKQNGLNSDVVNHTFEDNQGNLWMSTENGINLAMYALPMRTFSQFGNISGKAERFVKFNNQIYLATSTGIYNFNKDKNVFEKNKFPAIQVWDLTVAEQNKVLLAATANGIYSLTTEGSKLIFSDFQNIFKILKSRVVPNLYYASHWKGIFAFSFNKGVFEYKGEISNLNAAIILIHEDKKGNLLLSSQNDGLYYVETSKSSFKSEKNHCNMVQFTQENGLPNLSYNWATEVNGEILVSTSIGVYHFDKNVALEELSLQEISKLKFTKYDDLSPFDKNFEVQIYKEIEKDDKGNIYANFSLYKNGSYVLGTYNKAKKSWQLKPFSIIAKEKIENIFPDNNQVWYGGTDVVYCYNKLSKYNYENTYNAQINEVFSTSDTIFSGNYFTTISVGDSLMNKIALIQPEELIKSFSYKNNDFTFHFSATSYIANNPTQYSCFLEGEDQKWSDWSIESSKTYMNLYEGKYIFKVKAKNVFGTESTVATYEFTILPPWYRTILAFIIYAVLAVAFVIGVVVLFTRNLNRIIKKQTAELQQQKDEIEHKNKEITDSIYYAKRIQDAIMPSNEYIKNMFADSFVFFKPKDIVSGDFYWANLRENTAILTAVDCTGHGVPGAFMSMMGNDYLSDIIVDSKTSDPAEILNLLRSGIIKALKQRGESGESKDGMDMALININKETLMLEYAGANNPLYIVRNKNLSEIPNAIVYGEGDSKQNLYEIKGNKFPVGIHMGTTLQQFTKHPIQLIKGDAIYLFSDGYADQFGGPSGKKLKYNQFKKYILESMFLTMEEQRIYLEQKLNDWQGELEQVDDVLVIGIRIV